MTSPKEPEPHGSHVPGATGPVAEPGPEPEPEQGFIRELAQFFIVPSLIVLLCVGIFVMFGLLTSERRTAGDLLQEVRVGRGGDRWQAAFELSRVIATEPASGGDGRLVADIVTALNEEGRDDPRVRRYLIIALEHLRNPAAGPALIGALKDPDVDVRLQAARALAVIASVPGAAPALIELLDDESADVRKVAVYALGQTRDRAAIPALQARLEDPLEDIRWNAALALAVLGDGSGTQVIGQMIDRGHLDRVEGITEEQKVSAIINGLQAVYLLRDPAFVPRVRELSESDPSLKVREVAIKTLEALGGEDA